MSRQQHLKLDSNLSQIEREFKRMKVDSQQRQCDDELLNGESNCVNCRSKSHFSSKNHLYLNSRKRQLNVSGNQVGILPSEKGKQDTLVLNDDTRDEEHHQQHDIKHSSNYQFGDKIDSSFSDFSQLRRHQSDPNEKEGHGDQDGLERKSGNNRCMDDLRDSGDWRYKCSKGESRIDRLGHDIHDVCDGHESEQDQDQAVGHSDAANDIDVDELAAYIDDNLYIPKKMSFMAEMMYT